MQLIITGALGHIGSQLIRELPIAFPQGKFILIDNLRTLRYASLFNLPEQVNYQFIQADVSQIDLTELMRDSFACIHLAAITDATSSVANKEEVERVNYGATKQVATACAQTNTRLLHISSTSVYGSTQRCVDENCSEAELQPQSPYAQTKLHEEQFIASLAQTSSLRAVCCRFGTIFGPSPGMRFHTAVNKFCWQAIMGTPLSVWQTAYEQLRPYLHLADAIAGIELIIKQDLFNNNIYNVLSLNTSVHQVISQIQTLIPDVMVEFVDSPIMNQLSYEVSYKKFQDQGFTPKGCLAAGIVQTIEQLRNASWARLSASNL